MNGLEREWYLRVGLSFLAERWNGKERAGYLFSPIAPPMLMTFTTGGGFL